MSKNSKKPSGAAIFFSMFLRAVVIILAVVILIMGAVVLKQKSDKKKTEPDQQEKEVDESILTEQDGEDELLGNTEEETTEEEIPVASSMDLKIAVLNGTETAGLAGTWKDTLVEAGYANVEAHNYAAAVLNTTIIVKSEDVGQDLLDFFPTATFEVRSMDSNETDADVNAFDIYVIIGQSDDAMNN